MLYEVITSSKRGQISFEFSIIVLSILLVSTITITYFLTSSFDEGTRTLDKIDLGAKTAVSFVNSGYNGTEPNGTIIYAGMTWNNIDNNYENITIRITSYNVCYTKLLRMHPHPLKHLQGLQQSF